MKNKSPLSTLVLFSYSWYLNFVYLLELQGALYVCLMIVDSQSTFSIIGRMCPLLFYHSSNLWLVRSYFTFWSCESKCDVFWTWNTDSTVLEASSNLMSTCQSLTCLWLLKLQTISWLVRTLLLIEFRGKSSGLTRHVRFTMLFLQSFWNFVIVSCNSDRNKFGWTCLTRWNPLAITPL